MRLGQWIVNILEDKYGIDDNVLAEKLFYMSNEEYISIVLAYYAPDAWKNREKNLNYKSSTKTQ